MKEQKGCKIEPIEKKEEKKRVIEVVTATYHW